RGARALAGDDGFTIIEVIVASVVLLVGMLGVLTMLTGSLATTAASNKRVAATNLARELVETTRGLDYGNLDAVSAQLQARGLGSGSPWTIARRGVSYTVTATTCAFDDPSDGYAATAVANGCNANAAGTDSNGDDFRRVTFRLAWKDGGAARSLMQTTLIVNPAGGLGPRILTITPLTQTITANVSTANVVWATTPAQSLRWEVDDGVGSGTVTGATSFTTAWDIGTSGSGSEVLDGSYTMSAQPFDERGIAGEARRADIVINRRAPYAPSGFAGGHDTRVNDWVDFDWSRNRERDILGYRVVWTGSDGALGGGNDEQVCPLPAAGSMLAKTTTSCADFSLRTGTQTYYIVAIDRYESVGDPRFLTVNPPGSRPAAPTGLTVSTVAGVPRLDWTAAAAGGAAFYRIYRDGTAVGYADRYDRTTGAVTTFTDSSPQATSHTYWVTAVDSSYNESDPLGPVTWP
ncbi:MAG: prepilin-type N-terminal cleavage/methylation domain-containing protein, partial [Actinomycetota bacterium]|nr:prepilin-type N-terminal cleavage/methylation domain-containing protein [Actinomycetota bacterium]